MDSLRIIAIANQKGGCGKTTTSINFAACLRFLQKSVLLIDMDPQGHSTCGLGVKTPKGTPTLYDFLSPLQNAPPLLAQGVKTLQSDFDIIPCNSSLNALEEELGFMPNYHKKLKMFLARIPEEHRKYDFVILDCPPNLGILTWNALNAADEVLIPVEPSFFSLHGLAKISETIQVVNRSREFPLTVHALLTLFNSEMNFSQEIYEEVRAHFQGRLFRTIIHEHITLKEAAAAGQSIVEYSPQSAAFQDYLNLAVEYLEREWNRKLPEKELGWDRCVESYYGPRQVSDGILFQFASKTASTVEIAGDFNHWIPEPLVRRTQDGLWQKIIPVDLTTFRYKFIVDGEWQVDPNQRMQKENAFGGVDSFAEFV
ncbi:MAG TPA: AAA family ATPase [Candidatus Omnitrophota bacterium]|nr:AAA family ATPase [Candidatus Omnitrophota bacterium]